MSGVPQADWAIIGGSSTFSLKFPEDIDWPGVVVEASNLVFPTPYGEGPPLKLFRLGEKRILTVKMHGWRRGVRRGTASQQLFWLLRAAGVKRIIAEGGVGAINHLLELRDVVVPSDYIDFSVRKDVGLEGEYLLIMREALCPECREVLIEAAHQHAPGRVFRRGIYAVTDGRHFESPAEVAMLKQAGADIVGQSLCPEVYLAREIGACYARIDIVVNYAEGIVRDWQHNELVEIFYGEARSIARLLLAAVEKLPRERSCQCAELRKPTLLREE